MATIPRLNQADLYDHIKKLAKDTVFNLLDPKDPQQLARARAQVTHVLSDALLHRMKRDDLISNFEVEVTESPGPLAERNIPKEALPGDKFGRSGIVVSSDGQGRGVVLDPLAPAPDPTTMHVKVSVRQPWAIDSIVVEFQAVDTAY